MLQYFRINDPYRIIGVFVLLVLFDLMFLVDSPGHTLLELKSMIIGEKLGAGSSMYAGIVDNTAPLAAFLNKIASFLFGRSILPRHITGMILIFIQAALWSIVLISRKAFTENTYLPSILFCLLTVVSYDMLALSGELVGFMFLLLALNNLFVELEFRVQRDEISFNLGMFVAIASLFSFGYVVYLLFILAGLLLFTRTSPRKVLLVVFGFLLPHLLFCTISFLNGSLPQVWQYYYASNLGFYRQVFISGSTIITLMAVPAFYFVLSLLMLQREARFSKYQSQVLQLMFLWIGFSVVYLLYCKNLRPQHLLVFIPALSFLLSHFFLLIRRRRYAEINFWILILGMCAVAYLARYGKLSSVDYSRMTLSVPADIKSENKKLLVLENNLAYLDHNVLATPYLNWSLAEPVFRNPGYYENLTEVYHAMLTDAPDMVIDRENLMAPFLERMPDIRTKYRRIGNTYQKIR